MALSDTVSELQNNQHHGKGKIAQLLKKLSPEDSAVLLTMLKKPNTELPAHILTKALWREYGDDCVDPDSVSKYRSRHLRSVDGL